ncbi:ATP-binding protein [Massilia sp. CFBP9012]|uniref:AAA family ATPase n=1 Tax=Massilia sp. CFBP9012 TaxID=3096531 RepID=UPI002A6B7E20|nr:ATP-binding protein [Massilia sp. CFBP9012]MDY0978182.1 ATP-binding protein [Massilia sp. CFBP9012]
MLIEFSVENFKSFRERQTFSMAAAPRLRKKNCVFVPDVPGEKLPALLKVAAIYGANASGKSNLLEALDIVRRVIHARISDKKALPVKPFRFDRKLLDQPTRIEFHFIENKCRYHFELALTESRIYEERLTSFPKGKEIMLYERIYDGEVENYRIVGLEGEPELHNVWKKLTPPRALFLSQAVENSSEELQQLRIPYRWLKSGSLFIGDNLAPLGRSIQVVGTKFPQFVKDMSSYLQEIDVPVTKIEFEIDKDDDDLDRDSDSDSSSVESLETALQQAFDGSVKHKTTLTHRTELGETEFDFNEESKGTRSLMGFYLPWLALPQKTIIVDELDSSLHPMLVENLVKKHLCNPGEGQLIFTTHDTHLMNTKMLRRDQLWITDRDKNGATKLFSIHDFEGREDEDVEKRYFEGRYRGLPILRSE